MAGPEVPEVNSRHSVALVGYGYWGRNHVRVLHELGVELTICDSDEDRLATLDSRFAACTRTLRYSDVLSNPGIEGVVLATPAATHYAMAREALMADKDVLVEKPMALDTRDAAELVRLSRERGRVLMVGHVLRYHPAVLKLKELVEAGALGEVRYIYSNRLNMGRVRREENALWSFAPHDISIIMHLTNAQPERVSTTGGAYLQSGIADVSLSSLRFENGIRGHIFVSWLHPFKEQRLVVVGSQRMAVFDDSAPADQLSLYHQEIELVAGNIVTSTPGRQFVPIEPAEPLVAECSHFLNCIETRATPLTDGEEGVRVLTVLQACQKSLELNGEAVWVDRVPTGAA